jgi:hypothetical protein
MLPTQSSEVLQDLVSEFPIFMSIAAKYLQWSFGTADVVGMLKGSHSD